jgi:hypothetical protein
MSSAPLSAEAQLRMARGWQLAGRTQAAITAYHRLLQLKPDYEQAHIELARLHLQLGDVDTALAELAMATIADGNTNDIHKVTVDALVRRGGLAEAFAHYGLVRLDQHELPTAANEVVGCLIVRNQELRLPFALDFHRALGIDHFLVIDNGSEDGTLGYLASQPDVNVWSTTMAYRQANWGITWMEVVLRSHRPQGWCLFVDPDELFTYAGDDRFSIPELTRRIEAEGSSAMPAPMLDCYSDKSVAESLALVGQDPREVCPYFDRRWHHYVTENHGPFRNQLGLWGGARQRVFPKADNYYLSKVPLIRYHPGRILTGGQHYTNGPDPLSPRRGALIHTKFLATLPAEAALEVRRGEHYDNAVDYRHYIERFSEDDSLSLYDPTESVRYEGTAQLVEIGVCLDGPHSR